MERAVVNRATTKRAAFKQAAFNQAAFKKVEVTSRTATNQPQVSKPTVVKTDNLPGIKLEHMSDGSINSTIVPTDPKQTKNPGNAPAGYRVAIGVDQSNPVKPMGPKDFVSLNGSLGSISGSINGDYKGNAYFCVGPAVGHAKLNASLTAGTVVRGGDASEFLRGISIDQSGAFRRAAVGVSYTPDGQMAVKGGISAAKSDVSSGVSYCFKAGEPPLKPLKEMVSPKGSPSSGGIRGTSENSIMD